MVADGLKTNDGFGASISFNASSFQSTNGEGSIEIALRDASLEFKASPPTAGMDWSGAVTEMIRAARRPIAVRQTGTERETDLSKSTTESTGRTEAKLAPAGFGIGAQVGGTRSDQSEAGRERIRSTDLTTQDETVPIEIMRRSKDRFEIHFAATSGDLVRHNPDLSRLSVLSVPEPTTFDHNSVSISLQLGLSDEGGEIAHSLHIRRATGAWSALTGSKNKQVIGELLISKFLEPLHTDTVLWPETEAEK